MKEGKTSNSTFKWYQILLPIVIGMAVMAWIFADQFADFDWHAITFSGKVAVGLLLALLLLCGREIGFICRYHIVTNGDLTWSQCFKVCMLCEFSSAVTPSSVGGSSLSMVFMNRYGISIGRGTTLMLSTIFFDGMFYVISCPLVLLFTPWNSLVDPLNINLPLDVSVVLWIIYIGVALWTAVLFMGIVLWPNWIKRMLHGLFSLRMLKKWQGWADNVGQNMVNASAELRQHRLTWWLKGMGVTIFSWVCRYLIVNALIYAFVDNADHWLVFARQAIVWLVLMVCPTPGGSGVSEWLFNDYYGDIIASASLALVVALLWRIFSYYIYLAIGAAVAPSWIRGDNTTNDKQ